MVSDLNMSQKNVWFCFHFYCFRLRNFNCKSHWNTLIFVDKKWCQIGLCPAKQCLIWLKLRFLSSLLTVNWEIWISNFMKLFFSIEESVVRSTFVSIFLDFFGFFVFFGITIEIFWFKKGCMDFNPIQDGHFRDCSMMGLLFGSAFRGCSL